MDRRNDDIFSPIKNSDEEKKKRRSDSFSKFLKGPDAFKNSSKSELHSVKSSVHSANSGSKEIKRSHGPSLLSQHSLLIQENVNEKTLSIKSASSKILQDKSTKSEAEIAEVLSSPSILDDVLLTHLESSCSLKKVERADYLSSDSSKENKDLSNTSLTKKYDKRFKNQPNEAQNETEQKHSSNTNILQLHSIKNSLQSNAAIIYKASASQEIKRTKHLSSLSQCDPLSQIQSRIEKMVSDAVESQVDNLQQLLWSHHSSLLKALHETKETLENRHVSERETLCKIMEELAEENCQLRNAASSHK